MEGRISHRQSADHRVLLDREADPWRTVIEPFVKGTDQGTGNIVQSIKNNVISRTNRAVATDDGHGLTVHRYRKGIRWIGDTTGGNVLTTYPPIAGEVVGVPGIDDEGVAGGGSIGAIRTDPYIIITGRTGEHYDRIACTNTGSTGNERLGVCREYGHIDGIRQRDASIDVKYPQYIIA